MIMRYVFTFQYATTLIRTVHKITKSQKGFTFQYATTLILMCILYYFPAIKFTFQYATTLMICYWCLFLVSFLFTFQYATTLIFMSEEKVINDRVIYIPICHYFNNSPSWMQRLATAIYIPICHYFNVLGFFVAFVSM